MIGALNNALNVLTALAAVASAASAAVSAASTTTRPAVVLCLQPQRSLAAPAESYY